MYLSVNGIGSASRCYKQENLKTGGQNVNFTGRKRHIDKSSNGKFDLSEAGNNFVKGVLSPVTAIIKHPVATIGLVAATAAACAVVPVLGPVLAVGFGAMGVYELGKSGYKISKNIKNGDYDSAEKNFEGLGQGAINTFLCFIGLKQSARVAKEAKLLDATKAKTLNKAQSEALATEVSKGTYKDAVKELVSLVTTKEGRNAVLNQFKKDNLSFRLNKLGQILKGTKAQVKEVKITKEEFAKTPEGIKRASMTSEEIAKDVSKYAKEAFDEYAIPEELRPQIKIVKEELSHGGAYSPNTHTIKINETGYREGAFDITNVIKHEATHAKEAILRETLTYTKKVDLTKEYLLSKIQNGDNNKVIYDIDIFGTTTMDPPKFNAQMKADFAKFAEKELYKVGANGHRKEELAALVEPLVRKNPEFVSQYKDANEAVKMLSQYAKSHELRFKLGTQNSINFGGDKLSKLGPVSESEAVESFKGQLETLDGNAANQTFLGLGNDFNQYQFSAEEVLAQQSGNNFAIKHYQAELDALRKTPNYDKERETYLLNAIQKAKETIIYKTKGKEYYRLYMESKRHPENKELAKQVQQMSRELEQYKKRINPYIQTVNGKETVMIPLEKEVLVLKRIKPGVTIFVPYNTTAFADYIANEQEFA